MPFPRKWSSEIVAEAERLCRSTDGTLRDIAADTGVPYTTLFNWITRYGWREPPSGATRRPPRASQRKPTLTGRDGRPAPRSAPREGPTGDRADLSPDTPADLAQKLEAVAARAIAELEAQVQGAKGFDPERTAKALAALTQTLKLVASLGGAARPKTEGEGGTSEPPPRSLAELRAELLRHCRRIRADRRSRGGAATIQPG